MTIIKVSPNYEDYTILRSKKASDEVIIDELRHEFPMLVNYTHMLHLFLVTYFFCIFSHELVSNFKEGAECLIVEEVRTKLSM